MANFATLYASLSDNINTRGRQWERLCKWYLQNDPYYKGQLKRVWLWDEWPGRWGPDAGIDLVAKHRDGSLWAIQSKAYSKSSTVSMRAISQFLTESARPQFSYRLLIATTNRISRQGVQALNAQEKPAGQRLLADLERAAVEWPASPSRLTARKPKKHRPRPHQRKAIKDVIAGFNEHDRGQMIMACGTGKTLTSLWVSETLEAKRTLVLVPSLSLLSQTLREWMAHGADDMQVLPVCSDETVRRADEIVSHTGELGMPVTTDPDVIARFLRGRGRRVVMATYQSSPRIADAYGKGRLPGFDLAIADEAHRTTGPASSDFATVLDSDVIKAKRRLFMTATPRYFTGRVKKAAGEQEMEIASMDDEAVFGPVVHSLTFGEAISRELLSDYRVVIVGIDDTTVADYVEHGTLVSTDDGFTTDARTLAAHIGLAKTMRKYDLKRIISFHSRVKGAQTFASRLPQVVEWMPPRQSPKGELWAEHVSGAMSAGQRSIRLDELRDLTEADRGMLSNARCLAEGVDVPTLDGVAFIDPKSSQVDIIQAVGRSIRKTPDKKVGTIVLPVFIDQSQDPDQVLSSSVFKPVWWVLNALRDHDADLAEALDGLRREIGRQDKARTSLPSKIAIDLPATVAVQFASALKTRLVENTTPTWEYFFGLLERYVEEHGTTRVRSDPRFGGRSLQLWTYRQRAGRERLTDSQQSQLEALSDWRWDALAENWGRLRAALARFEDSHGHTSVPKQAITVLGIDLGSWISTQRVSHKSRTLSARRIRSLEKLSTWSWTPHRDAWSSWFDLARVYAAREGHTLTPARHREQGRALGIWISEQRLGRRRLSQGRREQLESLPGWSWSVMDDQWDWMLGAAHDFAASNDHLTVRRGLTVGGQSLRIWISTQRSRYDRGVLSPERIALLEAIPHWSWYPYSESRYEFLQALQRFVEREGHALVPQRHTEDGLQLGIWVNNQRNRREELSLEEVSQLEGVRGWSWDPIADAWESARLGAAELLAGVEKDVRTRRSLGSWMIAQRRKYRDGRLSRVEIEAIEAIQGWSWDPIADSWEEAFVALKGFADREGHARVPQRHVEVNVKLGVWVNSQRSAFRRGRMPDDRIARLEEVAGWAWSIEAPRRYRPHARAAARP